MRSTPVGARLHRRCRAVAAAATTAAAAVPDSLQQRVQAPNHHLGHFVLEALYQAGLCQAGGSAACSTPCFGRGHCTDVPRRSPPCVRGSGPAGGRSRGWQRPLLATLPLSHAGHSPSTHHDCLAALGLDEQQHALGALCCRARPRAEALCHDVAACAAGHAARGGVAHSRQQRSERFERLVERGRVAVGARLGQQRGCERQAGMTVMGGSSASRAPGVRSQQPGRRVGHVNLHSARRGADVRGSGCLRRQRAARAQWAPYAPQLCGISPWPHHTQPARGRCR